MPNKGKFIGSLDNLFVPDAPTIGDATAGDAQVSVAFTAPSDVGADAITLYGASVFLAGATINYKVSVGTGTLSTGGSGNIYFIDGNPTKTLSLIKGFTYVFDLSDSSNSGHPFGFKNASDGAYTTGVTTSGTAGSASATVTLVLATDASEPSRYYCTSHGNGMGNTISLIEASASTDPLGAAQAGTTGSSSPITVTGLSNGTSYIAQVWAINDYCNVPLSAATASFSPVSPRGVFSGGTTSSNVMDYITISSTGNATDFGDLPAGRYNHARDNCSSSTRGIASAGGLNTNTDSTDNVINYITIASTGDAQDFGNLDASRHSAVQLSNDTRGIFGGGSAGGIDNVISYITIASVGNATDFGDLSAARYSMSALASPTRGVFGAGWNSVNTKQNTMEYITIGSTGNVTDFGDLSASAVLGAGSSNNTRGLFAFGLIDGGLSDTIEYITIASTGNATDFGNLSAAREYLAGTAGNDRGIFAGGDTGSVTNIIDYVTITSTGNAQDFGDLTAGRPRLSTMSNSHGGLS